MKAKHPFRKTILIITSFILLIFLVIGVLITDFGNNTPSYVKEVDGQELGEYLGNKAELCAKDTGAFDDFEYLFNEEELNDVLALIVPLIEIPMVNIKSIYLTIEPNNDLYIEAPFWALFYKSLAKAKCSLSYDDTKVRLVIEDIRIREFSSQKGIVKSILNDDRVKEIETSINEAGVELKMWKEDYKIIVEMSDIDIAKTIINTTKGKGVGFLTAALVAGTLNSSAIDIVINENGYTGIIVHKFML